MVLLLHFYLFQPLKDDGVVNAQKNQLDAKEENAKVKPPFNEVGEIVDCSKSSGSTEPLCKKIYRISPKESAMQYTLGCDYRSYVTRHNGQKCGIYPMLVQSKYRIDEKRPMGPNGEEKKPWSKFFFKIQSLFYHYPRNRLHEI